MNDRSDDKAFVAQQIHALFRLVGQNLNITDSEKMQIADLYPAWQVGKAYTVDEVFKYGYNDAGETQLYTVIQAHTSADEWKPESSLSLYKKIGFTESGVSIWTQPLGASDAYNKGDRVDFNGEIWTSDIDGNVWQPGVYGWTKEVN